MNWKGTIENGQVSKAVKALNPHLFMGGLGSPERKQDSLRALDGKPPAYRGRKKRLAIVVTITSHRNRETDDDNCGSGPFKPLRDAIARSLALDDGDKRIRWEYRHIVTKGRPGTHVTVTAR